MYRYLYILTTFILRIKALESTHTVDKKVNQIHFVKTKTNITEFDLSLNVYSNRLNVLSLSKL
jgi:hypothetical protein